MGLYIRVPGETYWWLLPLVNITVFNQVLADLAEHFGNRKNKPMILVLDRAGRYSSQKLNMLEGRHLEFLPAHTPELQPAERLWPIIRVFSKSLFREGVGSSK
ncbi:MAG: transposase [Trichodesmium sp. MAG_R03]|nr:transposase [Trichodesmium sp. MAG_R03]